MAGFGYFDGSRYPIDDTRYMSSMG